MTRHAVVMITTSYPRFPGDGVGSFIEPIAKGIAARGHDVHLVAPWHPAITRQPIEDGVHFHFFKPAGESGGCQPSDSGATRSRLAVEFASPQTLRRAG